MYSRRRKGLRSRAWFKLDEIQQSDKLFKPGMTVVDWVPHRAAGRSMWSPKSAVPGASSPVIFCQWILSLASISFRAIFVMNWC